MASLGNKLYLAGDVQKRDSSTLGITREEHFSLHASLCQARREGCTGERRLQLCSRVDQ